MRQTGHSDCLSTFFSEYLKIEISVVEEMKKATYFKYLTARVNTDVFITSSMKTEQMSSENHTHLCSTLVFKARLDRMDIFC